jgi:regulator of cell morphogenesis and NO signaling
MTITEHTHVAEIATAVPSSVRVLQPFGIDFCCGGKTPLGVACEQQGLSFAEVASAISIVCGAGGRSRLDDGAARSAHRPHRPQLSRRAAR